ncbi:MAG: hypothetical protein WBQ25_02465 [Nitrososphaeraceae archaeon]
MFNSKQIAALIFVTLLVTSVISGELDLGLRVYGQSVSGKDCQNLEEKKQAFLNSDPKGRLGALLKQVAAYAPLISAANAQIKGSEAAIAANGDETGYYTSILNSAKEDLKQYKLDIANLQRQYNEILKEAQDIDYTTAQCSSQPWCEELTNGDQTRWICHNGGAPPDPNAVKVPSGVGPEGFSVWETQTEFNTDSCTSGAQDQSEEQCSNQPDCAKTIDPAENENQSTLITWKCTNGGRPPDSDARKVSQGDGPTSVWEKVVWGKVEHGN